MYVELKFWQKPLQVIGNQHQNILSAWAGWQGWKLHNSLVFRELV